MQDLRTQILQGILNKLSLTLTDDQERALDEFLAFYQSNEDRTALLLTGSAGTGKTFMINIFTQFLRKMGYKVVLLAPTGRAAKVISKRSNRLAYTIHHHIYHVKENTFGQVNFFRRSNKEKSKTVYVVDEASMIGDKGDAAFGQGLLRDLLDFVFEEDPQRKLIMVGDPVQLPPVGHKTSPAIDADALAYIGDLEIFDAYLSEVKRQLVDSGVLGNAVLIRDAYLLGKMKGLELEPGRDVMTLENGYEGLETYIGYFREGDLDRVIFITYSNYQAMKVNQAIRYQLLETQELIIESDLLMVVKNNYAWGDPKKFPFIANGEMGTVRYVAQESYEERYGLKWIDAEVEFIDAQAEPILIHCKLMLDLLNNKQPQMNREQMSYILQERRREYDALSPSMLSEQLRKDPYVNALQVKYGYAITGHKSQGGQWENVIIGFEPDYGNDLSAYTRWAYTVFTRAEERVYLLNCPFVSF